MAALPFMVVAPGWVAALFEWAAAMPVAEPAWAGATAAVTVEESKEVDDYYSDGRGIVA